jgi:hypothetical protein
VAKLRALQSEHHRLLREEYGNVLHQQWKGEVLGHVVDSAASLLTAAFSVYQKASQLVALEQSAATATGAALASQQEALLKGSRELAEEILAHGASDTIGILERTGLISDKTAFVAQAPLTGRKIGKSMGPITGAVQNRQLLKAAGEGLLLALDFTQPSTIAKRFVGWEASMAEAEQAVERQMTQDLVQGQITRTLIEKRKVYPGGVG